MAVSSSSYFNNAIVGQPQVGGDVDITETHTSPKYAVGQLWTRSDGAKFAYAHFGATTTQGRLCSQDISESGAIALNTLTVVAPNAAQNTDDGTTNSHYIEATAASVTAS